MFQAKVKKKFGRKRPHGKISGNWLEFQNMLQRYFCLILLEVATMAGCFRIKPIK